MKSGVKIEVKIYHFLLDGWYPRKIAKHLKISEPAVAKHIKKLVGKGLIERTGTYPAFYRKKSNLNPHTSLVGNLNTEKQPTPTNKPIFIPHKFGATFIIIGRANLKRDSRGMATIKELNHTLRLGKAKAVIWLKNGFTGSDVEEQLNNAKKMLDILADKYSKKYGITLTLDRYLSDVEWVLNDKPASKTLSNKADIKHKRLIAGADFKYDDATHPGYIEINKAKGYSSDIPTEHAKTLEYLLLHAPSLLKQLTETTLAINMKLEALDKRLR